MKVHVFPQYTAQIALGEIELAKALLSVSQALLFYKLAIPVLALCVTCLPVSGQEASDSSEAGRAWSRAAEGFDEFTEKLWEVPTLYENEENLFVQKLALTGRYQGQWHETNANTGGDRGWENRRSRLGFSADLFRTLELDVNFNLAREHFSEERFFRNVDSAVIGWNVADDTELRVGKMKIPFAQEGATSSRRMLTFERSLVVGQTSPSKLWGVLMKGKTGKLEHKFGGFAGAIDRDWGWPEVPGGFLAFGSLAVDTSEFLSAKKAEVRIDYLYNNGDRRNRGAEDYGHTVSLNSAQKWAQWGLNTDLVFARGLDDEPDVFGGMVMPYFDLSKDVRLVARYQYATSHGEKGIRLASRYELPSLNNGSSRDGDGYHALYGGIVFQLHGDKLKLMSGVEWSTLSGKADYEGWSYLFGVRMYF